MNKKNKFFLMTGLFASTIAAVNTANNYIFNSATSKKITDNRNSQFYEWKQGKISYTISGQGTPLLLVHQLDSAFSSYEWNEVIKFFSKNYKVYALDLLGCGYSEKPDITYTAYMYTQLLNDFVVNVIKTKVPVIVSGSSSSIVLMAAFNNKYLFNKIFLISPDDITQKMNFPDNKCKFKKNLLNFPVIGTALYNFSVNKNAINRKINNKVLSSSASAKLNNSCHETAHLGNSSAKYLYSSVQNNYTSTIIFNAVKNLENDIFIISGEQSKNIMDKIKHYVTNNSSIRYRLIENCADYPHIEQPVDFYNTVTSLIK